MKLILSVEPIRFPLTGIGRYTFELASRLQQNQEIEDLRFCRSQFLPALPKPADQSDAVHGLKRLVQKNALAVEAYRRLMPLSA